MPARFAKTRGTHHPAGPGLFEACLWTVGFHAVQFGALGGLLLLLLWCATDRFPPSLMEAIQIAERLRWESTFLFTGVASLAALLVLVPAVRLRIGQSVRAEFGLRRLSLSDWIWIAAAVVPLAVLSDQLYRWGLLLVDALRRLHPEFASLPSIDAMQVVTQQVSDTPYLVLLIAGALAPAVSEEFVFRGLIGRGLIARWGPVAGIGLTSLLFAAAHGTPAHALATLPVGIYLHLIYRSTGNLGCAILLHGLVNGLSVTLMKLHAGSSLPAHPALLFAIVGYLTVVTTQLAAASAPRPDQPQDDANPLSPASMKNVLLEAVGPISPRLASCSIVAYTCAILWSRMAAI